MICYLHKDASFGPILAHLNHDRALPQGKTVVHASGLGDIGAVASVADVSRYTGFDPQPDRALYQCGVAADGDGSILQAQGNTVGMYLNSRSSPSPERFKVAQWAHCWQQPIFPWAGGNDKQLRIEFEAAVPHCDNSGGAINYAYMAMAVRDCATQTVFWVQQSFFDTRGKKGCIECFVHWAETDHLIALSYFGGEYYCMPLPKSRKLTGQPWREWRYFGNSISSAKLLHMIVCANTRLGRRWSGNLDQYQLELIGVGPEVCTDGDRHGSIGMKLRNLCVSVVG